MPWGDWWTNDWRRWEPLGSTRKEKEMMMEGEETQWLGIKAGL